METLHILQRYYRLPPRKILGKSLLRAAGAALQRWCRAHTSKLVAVAVLTGAWMLTVVYYYNLLLDMRYNVQEAAAQIQVAEQKRTHVRSSLTELVRYYARYERELMREVTTLRTAEKPLEGASVQQLIARLDAVAEQYPQLHLTKSIEQFVTAINQTETEIAERIAAYNKIVNDYTTLLNQFPAKVYGAALGFENMEFYRPSANVLGYHEVQP